jgi:hypothetical protein
MVHLPQTHRRSNEANRPSRTNDLAQLNRHWCRRADVNNLRLADSGLEVMHVLKNLSMTSEAALPAMGVTPDTRMQRVRRR